MFGCTVSVILKKTDNSPFFAVVMIYSVSVVKSIMVVGNSYPSSQNYPVSLAATQTRLLTCMALFL